MRAITVRQPWAWAIVHGGKDVENRSRNIAGGYRGPVAIHAGMADSDNAPDSLWLDAMRDHDTTVLREPGKSHARWQPRGAFIGVVDLVEVHHDHHNEVCVDWDHGATDDGLYLPCSPWAMADHWHLCLTNPRPLPDPIPAKGRLGLWTPDDDAIARMAAQARATGARSAEQGPGGGECHRCDSRRSERRTAPREDA